MRSSTMLTSWWQWRVGPVGLAILAVGSIITYLVATRGPARSARCAGGATLVGVWAVSSEVQATSMMDYKSHMIEHLVVILVIAPLLASSVSARVVWSPLRATIGFLAFTTLVPLFHLTELGGFVMSSPVGHVVELLSFLVVGMLFWMPVYGPGSELTERQRLTYVLLATPVIATTGLVLWSSSVASLSVTNMNMSAVSLSDVHAGGMLMMIVGSAMMVAHLVNVAVRSILEYRRVRLPIGRRVSTPRTL